MKNHKIKIKVDKETKIEFVTKEFYEKIWKDSYDGRPTDLIKINGNVYQRGWIISMEQPQSPYPTFDPRRYMSKKTPEFRLNSIESMAKGLKKCIPSETGKPERLLEKFKLVYLLVKKEK